jgi:hypothetical protein
MKRINVPEIEDHDGLPSWLRDAMTGYLQVVIAAAKPYAAVAPALADLVRLSGTNSIVDLASGGGGPWPTLINDVAKILGDHPNVTLTDLAPNLAAAEELEQLPGLTYRRAPLSALKVPAGLDGVRTMFTGLHHFSEREVRSILRGAQEARVPFLAAEATHRSARGILVTLFIPLLVLFLMPRVRPRRILPLLLTYFPPIMPMLIWWDGFASTLKTYRSEELKSIVSGFQSSEYNWSVEEIAVPNAPIPVTLIVGRPAT